MTRTTKGCPIQAERTPRFRVRRLRVRRLCARAAAWALIPLLASCGGKAPVRPGVSDPSEALSGGETTVFNSTSQAFSLPAANLRDLALHQEGDAAFEAGFVNPPAAVHGGLGPLFSNTACVGCHAGDGRGTLGPAGGPLGSLLIRLSVPGMSGDGSGGPNPVPGFGLQVSDHAVFGTAPEAQVSVTYSERAVQLADGGTCALRTPTYRLIDVYAPLPPDLLISPRMALPVFGRGLLEAVPEAAILALADESDGDGDGISGRPNFVYDSVNHRVALGRFGWKANQPSLLQQAAAAYNGDMGVTSPVFTTETAAGQPQDDGRSDDPELASETLQAVTFYLRTLAVPARRSVDDPVVRRGQHLFLRARCGGCHVPTLETGVLDGVPEASNQTIHPYTDLLLHDMGEALADGRPDFVATGREWRTPPLWGIGLTSIVQGEAFYLHDGRARTLLEAILFHGGEAEEARELVRTMPEVDRRALLRFLESL